MKNNKKNQDKIRQQEIIKAKLDKMTKEMRDFNVGKKFTHLSYEQQLQNLTKNKNCKVDVKHREALNTVKGKDLTQFYDPYEHVFSKLKMKNTDTITSKFKYIEKQHKNHLRREIKVDKNFSIETLINMYKSDDKNDYNPHNFSDVIELNKNDDELYKVHSFKIKQIDLVLKSAIGKFLSGESSEEGLHWVPWIIDKIHDEFKDKEFFIENLYTNKLHKKDLNNSINRIQLVIFKNIITIVFKSQKISPDQKSKFIKMLFVDGLSKYNNVKNLKRNDLLGKVITFPRIRNSTMHSESFNTFLVKELVEQIKYINYKKDLNIKFWLVKNTNKDKSIKVFIENYKLFKNLKENWELQNNINKDNINKYIKIKRGLYSQHISNVKIGYYVEVEYLNSGVVECLELKILDILNWWFK